MDKLYTIFIDYDCPQYWSWQVQKDVVIRFVYTSLGTEAVNAEAKQAYTNEQLKAGDVTALINEGYHNTNESLVAAVNRLVRKYPQLVEPFNLGYSQNKVPILGIKLSIKSKYDGGFSSKSRPKVALLGGIHGDHALGHELVLYMSAFLSQSYASNGDPRIKNLLNFADIYLIPTLNPDGFRVAHEGDCNSAKLSSGRLNANQVDLDRDFQFHNYNDISSVLANNRLQPETKAFVDWIVTGDLRTEHTYGLGDNPVVHNPSSDKSLFEFLGHNVYYRFQPEPRDSHCNPIASNITVINGALLGPAYGTLSDFLYSFTNMFPINIYLDCCKYPTKDTLESELDRSGPELASDSEDELYSVGDWNKK